MAELITRPVTEILKALSSLAVTEFLELYHLRDGVAKLKSTLPQIEELLDLLEENQLKYWLELAEAARYDVKDLISSWEAEYHLWEMKPQVRRLVPFPSSNLLSKHRVSAELKKVRDTLDKIISEGRENTKILLQAASVNREDQTRKRETGSQLSLVIVGRGKERDEIIDLMKDETSEGGNFSIIPIVGPGGVGKTFLAQLVYNHFIESQEHFDVKTWVWVTADFNIKNIFSTIVKNDIKEHELRRNNLNPDLSSINSATLDDLKGRVKKILTGKKFLIVLDDLWHYTHGEMNNLVDVLSLGGKGSKVLVTSRNIEVSDTKFSKSPNHLNCLDGNQSWSLFEQFAFKEDGEQLPEFVEQGKQIVNRCRGLPLAIKTIGAQLCGKELRRWKHIAESPVWKDTDDEVLPALRLSYNNLPSHLHKKCFAYCALFPKSFLFEKDELVKLWMAEGFVQPKEGEKLEDIGADYFDYLSQRTLLECSNLDVGKHTMHDLLHDLAQTVSKPFSSRVIDMKETSSLNENTRHVGLLAEQVEQPTLEIINKSTRVHTLLFPVSRDRVYGTFRVLQPFADPRRFGRAQLQIFQLLVYMHVLDISSSALQTLPDSIREMKLLRYLDVSKTEINELPESICDLYHLQTLKLLGCPFIFSLPKKFRFLVHLRHLELDDVFWFNVKAIPQSIGRLTNLHNLHKFQVGCNTGYKLEELKDMEHLTGKLHISNLENAATAGKKKNSAAEANSAQANLESKKMIDKIVYEWTDSEINLQDDAIENKVLEDLKPPPGIKELRICHYRGSELPSWMGNGHLQELVTIVLNDCNKIKKLTLGKLPKLKEVHLKNMQLLKKWKEEEYESLVLQKTQEDEYQPLTRVTICNCPSLVKLPNCFSKLDALKIIKCKRLENIPFGPMRFITLEDNAVMKHCGEENLLVSDRHNTPTPREQVIYNFSRFMINLKIVKCPELSALPAGLYPQKLEISECSSLSALPTQDCAQRLILLALDSCQGDTLLGKIPRSPGLLNLMISNIKDVRCLPTFPEFPKLETLHIHDCPDLEHLSTPENRLFERFTCLETLSIKNCPKLVTLPAEGLPTSLRYLNIGPCESLNSFGPGDVLVKLNSLQDFYIEGCPALQSLPKDGLSSSLLHLSVKGSPLLMRNCVKDGSDWEKIKDISDLEIETPSSSSIRPWYKLSKNRKGQTSK